MARSSKMMVAAALLALALAVSTAEARNIKTTTEKKDDAVVQPQTFPPFDRLGGGASPAFGGLPGGSIPGSSIPGFSMPGSGSSLPGFSLPGSGSPGFSGFGGMPGSPTAGSVPEHANKP